MAVLGNELVERIKKGAQKRPAGGCGNPSDTDTFECQPDRIHSGHNASIRQDGMDLGLQFSLACLDAVRGKIVTPKVEALQAVFPVPPLQKKNLPAAKATLAIIQQPDVLTACHSATLMIVVECENNPIAKT